MAERYDHPNCIVRREHYAAIAAGATTESAKFRHYQKIKLKQVHAVVTTAGTATTHILTIKSGTTSIGAITLSTSTAGETVSSGVLNTEIPALTALSCTSGADATGAEDVVYEFEVQPDAVNTA